jgi:hypothetical protein
MHNPVRLACLASIVAVAAAGSASAQPATVAGGPPASQPPGRAAPGPIDPRFAGTGGASTDQRDGLFLAGSVGMGAVFTADLRLGWVIGSRFGLFASLGKAVVLDEEGEVATLTGVGARLWHGGAFLEGGAVGASEATSCEFDESCRDRTVVLGRFGAGGEFVHTAHFGMELRGEVLTDGRDAVYLVALGMTTYL